jgi:hypothetical protein
MREDPLKNSKNRLAHITRNSSWLVKFVAIFALCSLAAVSANATLITNANVTGQSGSAAGCIGQIGAGNAAFEWSSTGAYLNAASGTTSGCYVGSFNSTTGAVAAGTEALFINLGGSSGEGTSAQLATLSTGWYALGFVSGSSVGAICGGTAQCTPSNANDGSSNSGEIDVLVNRTNAAVSFTIKNAAGTANSIANLPSAAGCGASATGGNTYTIAANTICFSDLSTGGSISMTIAAPASVPEPATSGLIGLGLAAVGLFTRRKLYRA